MIKVGFASIALISAVAPLAAANDKIGYEPLVEGRTLAAIAEIESNDALQTEDPARLINLGIAYARTGKTAQARALFEAAMRSENRLGLETANGEWKDSRHLARLALKMLDDGQFANERMAAR